MALSTFILTFALLLRVARSDSLTSYAKFGCYQTWGWHPMMNVSSLVDAESCFAASVSYPGTIPYFALRFGTDCDVGFMEPMGKPDPDQCNIPCRDNPSEICGGTTYSSVYKVVNVEYDYLGCFLASDYYPQADNVSDYDIGACYSVSLGKGGRYFGVRKGGECHIGYIAPITGPDPTKCNVKCRTTPSEICGGEQYLSVYEISKPKPYTFAGCFLSTWIPTGVNISTKYDAESCWETVGQKRTQNQDSPYFGLKNGGECWGGIYLPKTAHDPSQCTMKCESNPSEICGDKDWMSVYKVNS